MERSAEQEEKGRLQLSQIHKNLEFVTGAMDLVGNVLFEWIFFFFLKSYKASLRPKTI